VDVGAIGAAEVHDLPLALDLVQLGVIPGNQQVVERDIARTLPAGVEVVTGQTVVNEETSVINQALSTFPTALVIFALIALFVGAFTLFNPFSTTVLHLHMTGPLGFSEQFHGHTVSVMSVGCILASVAYGFYCRRVPMRWLVHGSIVLGIASTLAYWALSDRRSALLVALAVGLTYMTATLIQLDLAARVCPPRAAGTTVTGRWRPTATRPRRYWCTGSAPSA